MSTAFVPLVPPEPPRAAAPAWAPLALPPRGETPAPFATAAASGVEESSSPAPAGPHPEHGEPRVTVERDGERITRIHVHCACGRVLDLACDY